MLTRLKLQAPGRLPHLLNRSKGRVSELCVAIQKLQVTCEQEMMEAVQASLRTVVQLGESFPSVTGLRQLHLPLSSPLTGSAVPNRVLWLLPDGCWQTLNPGAWKEEQQTP